MWQTVLQYVCRDLRSVSLSVAGLGMHLQCGLWHIRCNMHVQRFMQCGLLYSLEYACAMWSGIFVVIYVQRFMQCGLAYSLYCHMVGIRFAIWSGLFTVIWPAYILQYGLAYSLEYDLGIHTCGLGVHIAIWSAIFIANVVVSAYILHYGHCLHIIWGLPLLHARSHAH